MKRNSIGIEIVPEYYKEVKQQFEQVEYYLFEPISEYETTEHKRRYAVC